MNAIYINPDRKHIFSATATDVILLGKAVPESDQGLEVGVHYTIDELGPDKSETCIVLVPREAYLAAIATWLDVKATYYKHTREFCGVGNIIFTDPKQTKKSFHLNEYDDDPNDDENVLVRTIKPLVYTATLFDIDMEHG